MHDSTRASVSQWYEARIKTSNRATGRFGGLLKRGGSAAFLLGVAVAEGGGDYDYGDAGFYEEFAAVEPVYWGLFQGGVGEQAVPEKGCGGDIHGEVEGFPEAAAEADAQVGRGYYDGDDVESGGTDCVF